MKIFVDTNIFLDLILKREYAKESSIILNAVSSGIFDGLLLDITLLNIDYIAKKQMVDIRKFLLTINQVFEVVGANNEMIQEALAIENSDFEDNLQYVSAKVYQCDVIITNDKTFYQEKIETFNSREFIKTYIKK